MNVLTARSRFLTTEECAEVWHFVMDCVVDISSDKPNRPCEEYEPVIQEWFSRWLRSKTLTTLSHIHPVDGRELLWMMFCEEVGKI